MNEDILPTSLTFDSNAVIISWDVPLRFTADGDPIMQGHSMALPRDNPAFQQSTNNLHESVLELIQSALDYLRTHSISEDDIVTYLDQEDDDDLGMGD